MIVGAVGAVLGGLVGWTVDLLVLAAVIGAVNGVLGGYRRIYRWRSPVGVAAFVLDSTWALVTTLGALAAHAVAALQRGGGYRADLSERADRHVYTRGLRLRRGFLVTIGNTVNGAGPGPRTPSVVDGHEHVHVWQARLFGPLFPLLYGGWTALGALVGAATWIVHRRGPFLAAVDAWAYYRNPFEWWAYSREGRWPPPRVAPGSVWSRPLVRPPARPPAR